MNPKDAGRQSHQPPSFPPPSCPRCSSGRTKFCYYNNYSVSQPRYFCKDCRRYWTHGGALRNIPSGGTSRKRVRIDNPTTRNLLSSPPPLPLAWSLGSSADNPCGTALCGQRAVPEGQYQYQYPQYQKGTGIALATSSISRGTFRPRETMQFFNDDDYINQTHFKFSPRGDQFGVVSVGFKGGAPPPPPPPVPSTPVVVPEVFQLDNLYEFGFPLLQRGPQHPPPPPTVWGSQNVGVNNARTTVSGSNYFGSVGRDPNAGAHVVNIQEWSELNDMDNEGDPFQY
ncbi:hypothetical protein OSB04_008197 [Centaurea solstitialis]|uniref:Dof zinc finger protein n=1 Tax=Centaurea solstitialis TaxID=347529 RepID=A0AA38U4K9_9ASTR|nr:hypothetical protein OSB04_008197 [Centaurea solstitialis]